MFVCVYVCLCVYCCYPDNITESSRINQAERQIITFQGHIWITNNIQEINCGTAYDSSNIVYVINKKHQLIGQS